jgi:hypothetical protein
MKARVKSTGEIVDETAMVSTLGDDFYLRELEPVSDDTEFVDYWTRLEHQYAGMAMQGLMANLHNIGRLEGRTLKDEIVDIATVTAAALVEKLKEE